jgi:hypothetical protein
LRDVVSALPPATIKRIPAIAAAFTPPDSSIA